MADRATAHINDAQLLLAVAACDRGAARLDAGQPVAINVQAAASQMLGYSMEQGGYAFPCQWWPSIAAAESGECPREAHEMHSLSRDGREGIVLEINLDRGNRALATVLNLPDEDSSHRIDAFESACPGFTHMLYTVLDQVSDHIWPVITPRALWQDFIYGDNAGGRLMCDADLALGRLYNEISDEMLEHHQVDDLESAPSARVIEIYREVVGGVLPSDFIRHFGRAAIGVWPIFSGNSPHEPIPNPARHILEDLSLAMANVALRHWCPLASPLQAALQLMDKIYRNIRDGARFASETYLSSNPSTAALQVWRYGNDERSAREGRAFQRMLDDVTRGAWESGESVECAGWFFSPASTAAEVDTTLATLQSGVETFHLALDLLTQIFKKQPTHAKRSTARTGAQPRGRAHARDPAMD